MGKAADLRARCWALYTDHNVPHEIKQVMLDVVKMIDDAIPCQHNWDTLRLVEAGGCYQYCTRCGVKRVTE